MAPFAPPEGEVEAAVRTLVGNPAVRLLNWEQAPVAWRVVSELTSGLYRLSGTLDVDGAVQPWSLVVKISHAPPGYTEDEWRREVLAYTSGILKPQNGFATARLLAVSQPAADQTWLWLEDVVDEGDELLSVERHALAARHLGVFNSSHLMSAAESPSWLFKNWLPGLLPLVTADDASELARQPSTWKHPAVQAAFPSPARGELERLTQNAPGIFTRLQTLPQSLCHLDPGRFNIRVRKDAQENDETVFLDWQMLGVGPLGTDLAMMNVLNLYRLYVGPDDAQRYSQMTFEAYLQGLHEGGVAVDREAVSYAYRAAAALRGGAIVRVIAGDLFKDARAQTALLEWGARWGWDTRETWRAWGENMRFLMALA